MHFITPIQNLDTSSSTNNCDIRIKRDDLYPMFLGGNKARKINEIGNDAISKGFDTIVTNGGVQSNHCRATALFCAKNNLKCRLVLHTEKEITELSGNHKIAKLAGAVINYTTLDQLAESMNNAIIKEKEMGRNPLYLWGGGHTLLGSLAYYKAFNELKKQCMELNWIPEYIIVPSGTGTTQAGIHVGNELSEWETKVIGISIAREKHRGKSIIEESCNELRNLLHQTKSNTNEILFLDDYVSGGYECTNKQIINTIRAIALNGVLLDPTYTGKAFWGLKELIKTKTIPKQSKILFWHTGGLLNLIASDKI